MDVQLHVDFRLVEDTNLFKVPPHVKLALLGHVALVQSRVDPSAGVRQTAVTVVLVRFDPTNVEFSVGAIITQLWQQTRMNPSQPKTPVGVDSSSLPGVRSSGRSIKWVCFLAPGLGPHRDRSSAHL